MNAMPEPPSDPLWGELAAILGPERLVRDPAELAFHAQDVFAEGAPLAAVARPADRAALAATVAALARAGIPMLARGGGLSYTDGYLARQAGAVLIDTRGLDRIVAIEAADRYVTVECGVTWAALDQALEPHGLRTPYWGPLSGLRATVGGALSQGSVFLGSALHGAVGDSVLGLRVVTPEGRELVTGSAAAPGTAPFTRWFGPDATGLFIGDAGTLGIKVEATLRLIDRPAVVEGLSFAFARIDDCLAAMSEVSRHGLASECFAFDPVLAGMRMRRASLMEDAKTLGQVVRRAGLVAGLKLVTAGRDFIGESDWTLHLVVEGDSRATVDARLAAARRAAGPAAREIEDSIPKVLRAQPFTPPNTILGPAGERWVPVHGIVPHSRAAASQAALDRVIAAERATLERHAIAVGFLYTTLAQQGLLIEPVFYWPDAHTEYHRRVVDPVFRDRAGEPAANPAATAEVARLKRLLADTLRSAGAVHFQLGKFYRWREGRDPMALALHDAIKRTLDPKGLMNPGALV
jgi:FAD/FMN-containing dehydrogenase